MIPIKDYIRTRSFPFFNTTFIAVNTAIFLYQIMLNSGQAEAFVMRYAFIPERFLSDVRTFWYTPVSALFLHGGFIHFIGNMMFLFVFGDNVEDALGHTRYCFFYILTGAGAGFVQAFFIPSLAIPSIGASGAISAILGAYLVLYPLSRVLTLIPVGIFLMNARVPAFFFLGVWAVIQFFSGYLSITGGEFSNIGYFAHIGGFLLGASYAFVGRKRYLMKFRNRRPMLYGSDE
jgi:membrane associated rhomboid family serine protease